MIILPNDLCRVPFHDALVIGFSTSAGESGFIAARLRVRLNPEEPLDQLRDLGISGSEFELVFSRCWQVKANLLGHASGLEAISDVRVQKESSLFAELLALGVGSERITHVTVEGSHGSRIDVAAEEVSITEWR